MSLFDITTLNGLAVDRWDYMELNSLSLVTEIRDKKDSDDVEEFKNTLKISGRFLIKSITNVLVPYNALTSINSLTFRISGGEPITIYKDTDMTYFKLMSQEIYPEQGQGWGVNNINEEWVSITDISTLEEQDSWTELKWSSDIPTPDIVVTSNSASLNYTDCVSFENAAVFNETREVEKLINGVSGTVDQYRTRVKVTQFFDCDDITAIEGLTPTLKRASTLPPTGYNDDPTETFSEGGIDLQEGQFNNSWVLTEFSIDPIEKLGGTMARVKFAWDNWTPWADI